MKYVLICVFSSFFPTHSPEHLWCWRACMNMNKFISIFTLQLKKNSWNWGTFQHICRHIKTFFGLAFMISLLSYCDFSKYLFQWFCRFYMVRIWIRHRFTVGGWIIWLLWISHHNFHHKQLLLVLAFGWEGGGVGFGASRYAVSTICK